MAGPFKVIKNNTRNPNYDNFGEDYISFLKTLKSATVPLNYYGGKSNFYEQVQYAIKTVYDSVDKTKVTGFADVFGGGGSVTLNTMVQSFYEFDHFIYNDIVKGLTDFYTILQSPDYTKKLEFLLDLNVDDPDFCIDKKLSADKKQEKENNQIEKIKNKFYFRFEKGTFLAAQAYRHHYPFEAKTFFHFFELIARSGGAGSASPRKKSSKDFQQDIVQCLSFCKFFAFLNGREYDFKKYSDFVIGNWILTKFSPSPTQEILNGFCRFCVETFNWHYNVKPSVEKEIEDKQFQQKEQTKDKSTDTEAEITDNNTESSTPATDPRLDFISYMQNWSLSYLESRANADNAAIRPRYKEFKYISSSIPQTKKSKKSSESNEPSDSDIPSPFDVECIQSDIWFRSFIKKFFASFDPAMASTYSKDFYDESVWSSLKLIANDRYLVKFVEAPYMSTKGGHIDPVSPMILNALCEYICLMGSFDNSRNMTIVEESANRFTPEYLSSITEASNQIIKATTGDNKCRFEVVNMDSFDFLRFRKSELDNFIKFYDPPYLASSRAPNADNVYDKELSDKHHDDLVSILEHQYNWILCGKPPADSKHENPYAVLDTFPGILHVTYDVKNFSSNKFETNESGRETKQDTTEHFWIRLNPASCNL